VTPGEQTAGKGQLDAKERSNQFIVVQGIYPDHLHQDKKQVELPLPFCRDEIGLNFKESSQCQAIENSSQK
jgi:hypothetical protein